MSELVTFVLPNGDSAIVAVSDAKLIADQLWEAALEPGAPSAAARILEGLRAQRVLPTPLTFDEREAAALLRLTNASLAWTPTPTTDDGTAELLDA